MKIVLVGAGAMGCLFAALLRRAGLDIWLLEINEASVAAIIRHGITLENSSGTHVSDGISITRDAASIGQAAYVIFFVKAFDTEQAAVFAAACVGPHTVIVTLQNGIGNVELLAEYFPVQPVLAGTTAHGATLLGPGHVRHAGCGDTAIAPLRPREGRCAIELLKAFEAAGICAQLADDMQALLWGKLLVNIGINPLAAILNINNGRIVEFENIRRIMCQAVHEGAEVACAKGISFDPDEQVARVENVCRATKANLCSMLQDIRAGRGTEIDYMNGAVVREGRALGVAVPVNSMLTDLVRARQMLAMGTPSGR